MNRRKKLICNTVASLVYQFVTLICGFILPRFFLLTYGSEVNGLLASITQFLGIIGLAECGVGAVVQSSLYKPLAEHDQIEISKIFISSERFFRKISKLLIVYTCCLAIFYPFVTNTSFDFWYTSSLICIVSISSFVQYFFSISYSLLLDADAYGFIQLITRTVALIVNVIISIILLTNGLGIHLVKLISAIIFMIQPVVLRKFVNRKYNINKKIILNEEPIKQKWNGFIQHISAVVLGNTDIVVLTFFSTLKNVSIYSIYFLVVNGVKQIINALTAGVQALFGNMYAKKEMKNLDETFSFVEWGLHTITTFAFTCAGVLIISFVKIYTSGINDANYYVPVFAFVMCLAQAVYCTRLPYNMMVLAAGHYKQTQASCIIEVFLNLGVSIILVVKYGLIGVAIGTLVAMLYRTVYLAWYLSKNILNRKIIIFIKHICVDCLTVFLIYIITKHIKINPINYFYWIKDAIVISIISAVIVFVINIFAYRKYTINIIKKILHK